MLDFPSPFKASTMSLRGVLCHEREKRTAFSHLILGRCFNQNQSFAAKAFKKIFYKIFLLKNLLKASQFNWVLQYQRRPVTSTAPLKATDRNIIICQFIFAFILACNRTPFSSQSLLLQQHPVLSSNLDFDRSGTIFTPLCPGVIHTVYLLLPKASAFLKALSQKKEIRVKLPYLKASWWEI